MQLYESGRKNVFLKKKHHYLHCADTHVTVKSARYPPFKQRRQDPPGDCWPRGGYTLTLRWICICSAGLSHHIQIANVNKNQTLSNKWKVAGLQLHNCYPIYKSYCIFITFTLLFRGINMKNRLEHSKTILHHN
jgi:hypothetical protein